MLKSQICHLMRFSVFSFLIPTNAYSRYGQTTIH
uniref:Uncharacterized protein n=1 Tax=Anguilla anguilla TaxID=7936 RepID=A0A0E9U530_ANGAN